MRMASMTETRMTDDEAMPETGQPDIATQPAPAKPRGVAAAAEAGPSSSSTIADPHTTPFWSSSRKRWVNDKVVAKSQIVVIDDGRPISGIDSHDRENYDDQPIVIDMIPMEVPSVRPSGDRYIVAFDVLMIGRVEQS